MCKRRIKAIVPNATDRWNQGVSALFDRYKDADTDYAVVNTKRGADSMDQRYYELWAALPLLEQCELAEAEGFDAVIVYCAMDPCLDAIREKLSIPVVGLLEPAVHFASMLGRRFSILSTVAAGDGVRWDLLRRYHLDNCCASIRPVEIAVQNMEDHAADLAAAIMKEGRAAVADDGADVLILGCGGILGLAELLSADTGVPVIEPGAAALKYCESLLSLGLSQSKKAYPLPDPSVALSK